MLQDHMLEPVVAYSLPSHLFLVSAWSAVCSKQSDPASCKNEPSNVDHIYPGPGDHTTPNYAWTDITCQLSRHQVSWKYYVDKQNLSFDAYLKLIEDDFLGGQRLDPKNDGRLDPRVRENAKTLGTLVNEFDFSQKPRPPLLLPIHPKTDLKPPPQS